MRAGVRSLLFVACAVPLVGATGCESTVHLHSMRGFTPVEACAVVQAEPVDACSIRTGDLVIEVLDAVVREWPEEPGGSLEKKKQPEWKEAENWQEQFGLD